MSDVDSLFPPDKQNSSPLTGVTRENFRAKLAHEACRFCRATGNFSLFNKAMHVGIGCGACGREHPLRHRGLMWLPTAINAWKRGTL